jgi:hypothetical protein
MKKWFVLACLILPVTASADLIRFEFHGVCTIGDCNGIGSSFGGLVDGWIETNGGLDADNILSASEVSGFGFNFGSINITSATHQAFGYLVSDASRTSLFNSDIFEAMTFQQFGLGVTTGATTFSLLNILNLGLNGWVASIRETTWCGFGCGFQTEYIAKAGGTGAYKSAYTSVPEPGTLGLVCLGLVTIAFTARRRRALQQQQL